MAAEGIEAGGAEIKRYVTFYFPELARRNCASTEFLCSNSCITPSLDTAAVTEEYVSPQITDAPEAATPESADNEG
jgi:hypothetical protein